ncbi:MAG: phospholipid carrier-dependent glycosyltransferase [Bacteroidetes bacterium]|nr:MAG: phospholipid carrier-dependent glycosyltransferase [Bacteroidota bacterium]
MRTPIFWKPVLAVAGLKLLVHLLVNTTYGIHRDGLLYLAIGRHPDWGYWSNPPLIGWLGWVAQTISGGSLWVIRLIPTLAGCGLVILAGLMAREFGGKRYAQLLAALAVAVSPAYLRASMLFQPVVVDILGWTVLSYLVIRYLNNRRRNDLLAFGAAFGLFFLNKYMVAFFLLALLPALLLTPQRRLIFQRDTLLAAGIAALLILPNLLWQINHNFPVVRHMEALHRYQLVNVQPADFLIDQLFMNFTGILVWVAGLWFLWRYKEGFYRSLFYLFAGVIALFLLFKGKHYYTLGIYPMLFAAGAAYWEQVLRSVWLRILLPAVMVGLLLPLAPLSVPLFPPPQMAGYCEWARETLKIDMITRWEDGRQHSLPQDFADMLGWEDIGQATIQAYRLLPPGAPVLIYGENYGQAGAADFYGRQAGLPPVVSFADTYQFWLPDSTDAQALIYINDELGSDVEALFADIRAVGAIQDTFAREYGTTVYLCQQPRYDLDSFWRERVKMVRER